MQGRKRRREEREAAELAAAVAAAERSLASCTAERARLDGVELDLEDEEAYQRHVETLDKLQVQLAPPWEHVE